MIQYNDYPLEEVAAQANELIKKGVDIHQKWTCGNCGSRQTMENKNIFYRSGKCEECNEVTVISRCNFLASGSWDTLGTELFNRSK